MKELTLTLLPFCIIAICVVFLAISKLAQRKRTVKTFIAEGMGIGMCLGVFIMMALHGEIAIGTSLGMLIGEAVGIWFMADAITYRHQRLGLFLLLVCFVC